MDMYRKKYVYVHYIHILISYIQMYTFFIHLSCYTICRDVYKNTFMDYRFCSAYICKIEVNATRFFSILSEFHFHIHIYLYTC